MATFRGESAAAVRALSGELRSTVVGAEQATAVAEQLFSVAATLRHEGALRRFATDSTVPVEAKQGLVREVFGSRIDPVSVGLVAVAVSRRWTMTRDLADALEHLGVVAAVIAAGEDVGRLADELFVVRRLVEDNPELRDALSDPARSLADKAALLRSLLAGKALPTTVTLAEQALAGSYRTVGAALSEYEKVAADVHGQSLATVHVASELPEAEVARLREALSQQYGRPVHINLLIDPAVIGGIRVEIGDDVIDGTIASRLDDARRRLVG